jgi:hypothetical protein
VSILILDTNGYGGSSGQQRGASDRKLLPNILAISRKLALNA